MKLGDKPVPEAIEKKTVIDESTPQTSYLTSTQVTKKRKRPWGYLGPKDDHFEDEILAAVGVLLYEDEQPYKFEESFFSTGQPETRMASQVFLNIARKQASKIASQFKQFNQREYDEHALILMAAKYLAPFDELVQRTGAEVVQSLCRNRWRPGKEGPLVPTERQHTYNWDIEPDMTYMPVINVLGEDSRIALEQHGLRTVLADSRGVCPYLTLEFKCREKMGKDSDAKCQIAAASVMWLHQRLEIMKLALPPNNNGLPALPPPERVAQDLRHFAIVLNSTNFQVWLATFDGKRYHVKMLATGFLGQPEGVEAYAKWWNAIHAWGLGPNVQSFKDDVDAILAKLEDGAAVPTNHQPLHQ